MSKLDEEFDKTAEEINKHLKAAADALREANRLAKEAKLPGLIYTQWVREDDTTLDDLSDEELKELDADEEWDGEMTPLEMKMQKLNVSDLEGEIDHAGWSSSSSYC